MTVLPTERRQMPVIRGNQGHKIDCCVLVNRPATEAYHFWRDFRNLPRFMKSVLSVTYGENPMVTHWKVQGPFGLHMHWDAEIINLHENELISWRTIGQPQVTSAGSVRFMNGPVDCSVIVRVIAEYVPPMGRFGVALAAMLHEDPVQMIQTDLYRMKQLLETGSVE
ncbi:MAG: SRPBCC family protein [Verrucomicrobiales bacterium]|nr:SRPBCC family protein [Verrucomicrobiales bacterium]